MGGPEKYEDARPKDASELSLQDGELRHNVDELQRKLNNRQIQLIAIGGSIGTALFISIGGALNKAGPAGMLIAYTLQCCAIGLVNNCITEMTVYMPVTGGFVRLAGHWVDDAFGFMAGWNFFFYEALLIPFEITAINLVLTFWRDDIPVAAVCAGCIVLYAYVQMQAAHRNTTKLIPL
jgi:amino acid transporter